MLISNSNLGIQKGNKSPNQPNGTVVAFDFTKGINDLIGNHTASLRGSATISSSGLSGTGPNDGVFIPNNSDFDILGDFTVEWWGTFTGVQSAQFIGIFGNSNRSFNLETWNDNDLNFLLSTSSYYENSNSLRSASGLSTLKSAGPSHFAGVREGTEMRMYLNGINIGTRACSDARLYFSIRDLNIGAHEGLCTGARLINGKVSYTTNFTPPPNVYQ